MRVRASGRPERLDSYDDIAGDLADRIREVRLASSVAAPVSLGGDVWGLVAAATVRDRVFSAGAEVQLGRFAELLSQALANAEAKRKLRESRARLVESSDAERRRLERNLDDGAQQRLVALRLDLRMAEAAVAHDRDKGLELLQQAQRDLDEGLEELRELARGLHPAILSDKGLGPALAGLSKRSAVPVELKMTSGEPLPVAVEAAFYYVASEALTNAARYAKASNITIEISEADQHAILRIRDDGAGGANPKRRWPRGTHRSRRSARRPTRAHKRSWRGNDRGDARAGSSTAGTAPRAGARVGGGPLHPGRRWRGRRHRAVFAPRVWWQMEDAYGDLHPTRSQPCVGSNLTSPRRRWAHRPVLLLSREAVAQTSP